MWLFVILLSSPFIIIIIISASCFTSQVKKSCRNRRVSLGLSFSVLEAHPLHAQLPEDLEWSPSLLFPSVFIAFSVLSPTF